MLWKGKWRKPTIGVKRRGGFLKEFVTTLIENNETEILHGVQSKYASGCQGGIKKPPFPYRLMSSVPFLRELLEKSSSLMNSISTFIPLDSCGLGPVDNGVP